MPARAFRWTREAVQAIPDTRSRYELVGSELCVTPSPGAPHQGVVTGLALAIGRHVHAHRLGRLYTSPADLHFRDDQLLQPDLFVLPWDASPGVRWERAVVPLLVIEVVSPGSAESDRGSKRIAYLEGGVREYWVADPVARHVERWRQGDVAPAIERGTLSWQPRADVPGLVIELVEVFGEAWRGME